MEICNAEIFEKDEIKIEKILIYSNKYLINKYIIQKINMGKHKKSIHLFSHPAKPSQISEKPVAC